MCLKLLMLGEISEIVNGSIRPVNCLESVAVSEDAKICFSAGPNMISNAVVA
jgi:hypothetical protein